MTMIEYIIQVYIYIVDILCPFTYNTKIKHKNSDDIQNSMTDDVIVGIDIDSDCHYPTRTYAAGNPVLTSIGRDQHANSAYEVTDENLDRYCQIPVLKARAKKQAIPVYFCGYCHVIVSNPLYMYNDSTFCTPACRTQQLILDKNTALNALSYRSIPT